MIAKYAEGGKETRRLVTIRLVTIRLVTIRLVTIRLVLEKLRFSTVAGSKQHVAGSLTMSCPE
jgi:hypothetical protein